MGVAPGVRLAVSLQNLQTKMLKPPEPLPGPPLQARLKRYGKMQEEKSRFSRKGRKTDNPRLKKKPRRPKH